MQLNRKTLLFLALAVVVGLAVFAPPSDEPVGSARVSNAAGNTKSTDASAPARVAAKKDNVGVSDNNSRPVLNDYPERGILGKPGSDLFGTQSWLPPPPKVVVEPPPPPPAPQPPAMTFRFAGRFIQDGKFQVFVSNGDTPIGVKVGDNLDGYVVEAITANSVALVYPPLAHKMSIAIPPEFVVDGSTPTAPFMAPPRVAPAAASPQGQGALPLPGMQAQQSNPAPGPAAPKPAIPEKRVK